MSPLLDEEVDKLIELQEKHKRILPDDLVRA